jgi:TPR repeat protein
VPYLELFAQQGNPRVETDVGFCYELGRGVDRNLEKAANHGNKDRINYFGLCLEFGKGRNDDISRAAECYRKAADLGLAEAQNNYGFCLEHGLSVNIDFEESFRYYRLSADQGHHAGAFHCACCLHYGVGVDCDLEAAASYYENARSAHSTMNGRDSFRCLRILRRAVFALNRFPELVSFRSRTFDGFSRVFLADDRNGTRQIAIKGFDRGQFDFDQHMEKLRHWCH